MKVTKVLALASVTGVMAAGVITSPALAWHPKGVIKKYVQNQTVGSALSDANTEATAVATKPGDVLKYVIEVSNQGATGQSNEMHFTKMADTLPAGVELVSEPTKRQIVEDLGVIKPGEKKTKEYVVKVTSSKDKDLIDNNACFTGDSEVHDNPQSGCDNAKVKVSVPPKQDEPKPEQPKPEQPKPETPAPQQPETLPVTGPSAVIAPAVALGSGALGYAGRLLVVKRRQK
jgi:uncharacterized repeat protein (TIGR01451 family)